MRDIKFRQWFDGQMIEFGFYNDEYPSFVGACSPNTSNYPIMQFTGLTDRNGVDIYEGDVVGFGDDKPGHLLGLFGSLGVVQYSSDLCRFEAHLNDGRNMAITQVLNNRTMKVCEVSVFGNIYQHPLLIDGDK